MQFRFAVPALLLSLTAPSVGVGQSFVTTTAHRVPFERLDTLRALLKETRSVLTEAKRMGGIIDDVWLIHSWGGEYTVLQVTTWKSWAAITDTNTGFDAAFKKAYPDSAARKKLNDRFEKVFQGVTHVDNIYTKAD